MVKVHINNTKHITIANIYIPTRDHIHGLQNSRHGHTTLHTADHKHTTLSPHRRCERTLHSLALVHKHTNQGAKNTLQQTFSPDITTVSNTLYNRHHGQLNTQYHLTIYPCCCRRHPSTKNSGGVQHLFIRTPGDGIHPI